MHLVTKNFAQFSDKVVMHVHGELRIANFSRWRQLKDSKRATETAHPSQPLCLIFREMTQERHHVTQVNVWLVVNIVMHVHDEFVITSQMSWCQFDVTKQSHKDSQKWSFSLISGQMTLEMDLVT